MCRLSNKRERDTDLSINTVHLDPEIHDILADSNVGLATIPGGGKYDVRLLAPILKALQKNELLSGIVSVQKMNQILKWHGINPKEIEMSRMSKDEAEKELIELKRFLDLGIITQDDHDKKAVSLKMALLGN